MIADLAPWIIVAMLIGFVIVVAARPLRGD
jgi:hypothetical protein